MTAKSTHTSLCIAQDTTDSREARLNAFTNQILAQTFSYGNLDIPLCLDLSDQHTCRCTFC